MSQILEPAAQQVAEFVYKSQRTSQIDPSVVTRGEVRLR